MLRLFILLASALCFSGCGQPIVVRVDNTHKRGFEQIFGKKISVGYLTEKTTDALSLEEEEYLRMMRIGLTRSGASIVSNDNDAELILLAWLNISDPVTIRHQASSATYYTRSLFLWGFEGSVLRSESDKGAKIRQIPRVWEAHIRSTGPTGSLTMIAPYLIGSFESVIGKQVVNDTIELRHSERFTEEHYPQASTGTGKP